MPNPSPNQTPIRSIEIENRLGAEVNLRTELRGDRMVVVIEPGRTPSGLYLPAPLVPANG